MTVAPVAHGKAIEAVEPAIDRFGHPALDDLGDSAGAPTFRKNLAARHFAENVPIAPFVLPAATGGDVTFTRGSGYAFPHFYAVSGLPPGLIFDPATREVSGTPTQAGTYSVTLTLDTPARAGDTVRLTYTGTLLRGSGSNGKQAPMFRGLAVTNATGTAGPAPVHASVAGTRLLLIFDGALDDGSAPAGSAFLVGTEDADGDGRAIAGTGTAAVSGTEVTVTLSRAVRPDEQATVSYLKPSGTPLRAAASGNSEVLSFDRFPVRWVSDDTPPALLGGGVVQTSATPAKSRMALYFDEALHATSVPAAADFAVAVGESAVTVSDVAVEASNVVLTLDRLAASGTAFTVSYTPGKNPIRDAARNAAAAFRQTLSATAAGQPDGRSAIVDGVRLAITYDRPLDPASVPDPGQYTLHHVLALGDARDDRTKYSAAEVAAVAVEVRAVVLRLNHPVMPCAGATPFTADYAVPDTSPLQGLDGTAVRAFSYAGVTNARAGWCDVGWFDSARDDGDILRARRAFARNAASQAAWFTVRASGGPVAVTEAAFSVDDPRALRLRFSREFEPDEIVTVSYTRPPGAHGLWDVNGRQLADLTDAPVTTTATGAALLSVADAEVHEGADEAVEFRVSLGRAASGAVTVDYATADGTAVAGEDYTATRGTLSFAQGEVEKTIAVPILDDVLDEGSETFTLRLRKAQGAAIADGEAVGTITNADPLQKMWLSRFGRTVAGHVTEAVSDRLANPLSDAQVTVGGQSVNLAETQDEAWLGQTLTSVAQALGASGGPEPEEAGDWPRTGPGGLESPAPASAPMRTPSGRELLLGSAFHLAREGDGAAPGLATWGRLTVGGFDGEAPAETDNVRIEGNVTTGILGADAEWNRLLAGVALSVSEGEGTFDQPGVDSGTIESTMITVSPYARFMVNDRVSAWGLLGFGTGDMTIVQAANENQPERGSRTDLAMRLAALGGRGVLLEAGETGVMDLALKADAFVVETEAEEISNEGNTTAAANRLRLILEGSRAFELGEGAVLTPSLELGLRHDGGDAETGTGVELGGGVSYADAGTGLSVEAQARMLVAHADSDYDEWGASATARLDPGVRGRGFSFSLSPTVGQASSASERLWGAQRPEDFAPGGDGFEASRGLQGELGYGLALFGDRFTGTPNLGFGLSDSAREYRIGWRLTSVVRGDPGFEVDLDALRRESANGNEPPEHGLMLRGAIRW